MVKYLLNPILCLKDTLLKITTELNLTIYLLPLIFVYAFQN